MRTLPNPPSSLGARAYRVALTVLPIALVWLAVAGYVTKRHDLALASAAQDSTNLAKAFEENIKRTVDAIDTTIRAVRVARGYDPAHFELVDWERESGLSRELTLQLSLTDRAGVVIESNLGRDASHVSIADREHFKVPRSRTDDGLFISRPVIGRVSHRWSVQFVRPLYDRAGQFDGVVVASLDPAFLSRFYGSLDIGDAMLLLIGRDGNVLAGASREGITPGQDLSKTTLIAGAAESAKGWITANDTIDHVNRVYSWRRIDHYDLTVVVGLSTAEALADYQRELHGCIAIGLALTIVTLVVSSVLARNRETMLRTQAVLQATVQNISQGLLVVDKRRRVPVINTRAVELLELPQTLARPGIGFDEILRWQIENGEFRGQNAEQVRALVKSGGIGATNSSYRRTRANGKVLEFHTKVLETGLAVRTITDITEQEHNAQRLADARDAAERAAHARSEFLAVMSHEIRTPLNGVIGIAGLLDDLELGPTQRDYVRLIRQSGDHLLALINDILDYSRLEASRLELEAVTFEPRQLATSVRDMLLTQALAKGLRLTVGTSDAVPEVVVGDPARLRQVLINLVGNAIKFTDAGWVSLDIGSEPAEDGRVRLLFSVSDSGIGIAPDAIERMFDEFTQAARSISRRYGGTGLGLAICRRLVEMMGGTIGVESEPDRGSTFRFDVKLPVGEAQASPAERALVDRRPVQPALRILLAEDNPTNRIVAMRLLERLGHRPTAVGNGVEAISAWRTGAYDLILMDVMMPEMDGLTATRAIRAEAGEEAHIVIVGLTAHSRLENLEECLAAGMNAVTTKPVTQESLRVAIAEGIASAQAGGSEGHVDDLRLRELMDCLGEDAVREIVTTFADDTRTHLRAMRQAAELGQTERVYRIAHGVAGAARNVGATALAERASALERDVALLNPAAMLLEVEAMQTAMDAVLVTLGIVAEAD